MSTAWMICGDGGCSPTSRAADAVLGLSVLLRQYLHLRQRVEDLPIHQLVPELSHRNSPHSHSLKVTRTLIVDRQRKWDTFGPEINRDSH